MKLPAFLLRPAQIFLSMLVVAGSLFAIEEPVPRLLIEPSSTKLSLAKAELSVGPLQCKEQSLCGTYNIKVSPFTFKNDHGNLVLEMSDANAKKLANGEAVEFSGLATSAKDGKTKAIKGKTKPEANDRGGVSFVVTTEDGELLFNSSYRITEK